MTTQDEEYLTLLSDGVFAKVPAGCRAHKSDPGLSKDPDEPTLDVLFLPLGLPRRLNWPTLLRTSSTGCVGI
ncbi:MAG: hypothetical protein IV100_29675 [Myxococcales bacterium]|nr:hypothetical protein [Myxococcales bacterium]